ncbi:MAG: PcfJ domain-containing protein [Candidatus Ornithomonoglobus sp.]
MDVEELIKKVPFAPPEGMKRWLFTLPRNEYIIYKAGWQTDYLTDERERVVECVCTACESMFKMPYVRSCSCSRYSTSGTFGFLDENNETVTSYDKCKCPICGAEATAIHVSCLYNPRRNTKLVISIHKVDDAAAIIQWKAKYMVYKDGRTDYEIEPDEAYLFGKKEWVRLCTWSNAPFGNRHYTGRWTARKRCDDMVNVINKQHIFPFDAKELDGTAMENSKLDLYINCCERVYPVSYLRLYQIHHNVENLVTSGLGNIISGKIKRHCPRNGCYSGDYGKMGSVRNIKGIDFKKNKPHEMLGLSKEEYRAAVRDQWSEETVEYYKHMKPFGADYRDVCWYIDVIPERYRYEFTAFSDTKDADGNVVKFNKLDVGKTASYLMKQQTKYENDNNEWSMLKDYWNMLIQLGSDYNNPETRYPQRLKRAHDQAAERIGYKKNKKTEEAFISRYNKLSKFSYFNDVLEIHPARSAYEMENEGKTLHHCVASYINSHAEGKTAIFFIRHRTEPEKPYFTLELDEKSLTVKQNRGLRNCARTDEVKEFETEWLEFIRSVSEKEKKSNAKQRNRSKAAA